MIAIYSDKLVRDGFAGCTYGPFIFIRPEYRNDKGLLKHEQTHVVQWATVSLISCLIIGVGGYMASEHWPDPWYLLAPLGLAVHGLLYRFVDDYRLRCEVEAYREQLKASPGGLDIFAGHLSGMYGLDIDRVDARNMLVRD